MQEDDWLPLLRLTMLAWMLPTDDHSLYEIMLGAEPYMSEEFTIAQGLDDMSRLCPPSRTLTVTTVSGDALRFPCADIWANVNSFVNVTSPFVHGWSLAQRQAWNELMSAVPGGNEHRRHNPERRRVWIGVVAVVCVVQGPLASFSS